MFIQLGDINIRLLILLIYPAGIIPARITSYYFQSNPYFYLFLFFISHFLIVFFKLFYIIKDKCNSKIRSDIIEDKSKKQLDDLSKIKTGDANLELIVQEKEKIDYRKEKILSILFIGILYFISYVFFYYSNYITTTNFYGNISMILEILFFSLFNRIILGNKLYLHHLFSMILITICILGLYIILMINFIKYNNNEYDIFRDIILPTILNFIVYSIFCFHLVKAKQLIEKYIIPPFLLIFSLGSFCLILLLIFEPFTFLIHCDNAVICYEGHFAGIITGFSQLLNTKEAILVFFCVIFIFMTAFGLWMTVIYLSPSHFLTSDSIITIGLNIMVDCYNEEIKLLKNPLFYILSIFTIFGCLIYNEIIVINIFGLNHNTRKEILKRETKENEKDKINLINFDTEVDELSDSLNDIEQEMYE